VLCTRRDGSAFHQAALDALVDALDGRGALTEIALSNLAPGDATDLVTALTDLPAADGAVQHVVQVASGNPFFLVELARQVRLDHEARRPSRTMLPPRIKAALASRLGRLSTPARLVAEIVAVVGAPMPSGLPLGLTRELADDELVAALDELWEAAILHEDRPGYYTFTHDIVGEVVYDGLRPARRRQLHAVVARRLAGSDAIDDRQGHGHIAAHYERAGLTSEAVAHYQRAVDDALHVFAYDRAEWFARRGLELLGGQPTTPERDQQELALLIRLVLATFGGPGIGHDHRSIFDRVQCLTAASGQQTDPTMLRVMANLANVERDFHATRRHGEVLLAHARASGDDLLVTEAYYVLGMAACWLGEHRPAHRDFELGMTAYRAERAPAHIERFGQDAGAVCMARLAFEALHVGDVAATNGLLQRAEERAVASSHGPTMAYVRLFEVWIALECDEVELAAALLDGLVELSPSTSWVVHLAQVLAGWVATRRGEHATALTLLEEAVAAGAAPTNTMMEPLALLRLGALHAARCDPTSGLEAARRARAIATTEMPFYLPEALLLEARLHCLAGADDAVVTRTLRDALAIARRQGTLLTERRARAALLGNWPVRSVRGRGNERFENAGVGSIVDV
jgi:hypothetical protein